MLKQNTQTGFCKPYRTAVQFLGAEISVVLMLMVDHDYYALSPWQKWLIDRTAETAQLTKPKLCYSRTALLSITKLVQ